MPRHRSRERRSRSRSMERRNYKERHHNSSSTSGSGSRRKSSQSLHNSHGSNNHYYEDKRESHHHHHKRKRGEETYSDESSSGSDIGDHNGDDRRKSKIKKKTQKVSSDDVATKGSKNLSSSSSSSNINNYEDSKSENTNVNITDRNQLNAQQENQVKTSHDENSSTSSGNNVLTKNDSLDKPSNNSDSNNTVGDSSNANGSTAISSSNSSGENPNMSAAEKRKAKLEAWKKKLEQEKLLQKIKEEEEKLKQQKNEKIQFQVTTEHKSNQSGEMKETFSEQPTDQDTLVNERVAPSLNLPSIEMSIPNKQIEIDGTNEVKKDAEEEEEFDVLMKEIGEELEHDRSFLRSSFFAEKSSKQDQDTPSKKREELLLSDDDDDDFDQMFSSLDDSAETKNKKDLKPVDHSKQDYPPFRKEFYIPQKDIMKLTEEEVSELRASHNIRVLGTNIPAPVKTWFQCGLNDVTLNIIKDQKYDEPFPIQSQAIPCIMSGRNVIGIAKTGSGKTLAFLMPMIRHVLDQPPLQEGDGPIGLIIVPTRELAVQIYNELRKFTKPNGLKAVCAYGGASIAEQIAALKRGVHIVVCTPGRMIDLLCANRGRVTNLFRVTYVVVDEADRMFDLGFEPQITKIVNNIRPDRQIVMFSATFPKPLEGLARKFLKDSIEIIAGGKSVACEHITQYIEIRTEETKFLRLLELLGDWHEKGLTLVFVDKQAECGNLFKELLSAGYEVLSLHGGMDQLDRDFTLQSFKNGEKKVLIATSVAARGLDIPDIRLVINYNVPNHYEDYVHRVGRTGRAGKTGTSYTFITPEEERYSPDLVRALKQSKQNVPQELEQMSNDFLEKKKKGLVKGNFPRMLSGFVGSGYKFTNSEQNKKKEEIKRQMRTLGMEDEIEDEENEQQKGELDEDGEDTQTRSDASTANNTPGQATHASNGDDIQSNIAKAKAFAISLSIQSTLGSNIPNHAAHHPTNDHFSEEIEINDYPQLARWKVTHKDALYEISDFTGCSVTSKGVHVAPGKSPPPGMRKLYLLVEGSTKEGLERAKLMIMRILRENSQTQTETRTTGRYKVV